MADTSDAIKMANGDAGQVFSGDTDFQIEIEPRETLYSVISGFLSRVMSPQGSKAPPLFRRVRVSFSEAASKIPEASRNSSRDLVVWTRRGTPLRALLVISVGMITLVSLTGLLVFMLFFVAATLNAIIISLLMSLAAAGGFLAMFFACMTAIYIVALSVAIFAISTATIFTAVGVLIATGWVGFFWMLWLAASKSLDLTKRSLSMTSSALTAYSTARRSKHD